MDLIKREYAENVTHIAKINSQAIYEAFATVPREHFLGPGPWLVSNPFDATHSYQRTPDNNLKHLYQDIGIGIDAKKNLNNGQPSIHAKWLDSISAQRGETIVHIGCGLGYYTAIIAELVGERGRVIAYEIDKDLAYRAQHLLKPWPQVRVIHGDSTQSDQLCDGIYINAGVTHPLQNWLHAVKENGRILIPITAHIPSFPFGVGFVLLLRYQKLRWSAVYVSPVGIYDCAGARDDRLEPMIQPFLKPGNAEAFKSLVTEAHKKTDKCLLHTPRYCIQK